MPHSPTYTRRWVLTIAMVTAASPAGILSLNAGVPADRRIVAQSRFDVTSAPLQAEVQAGRRHARSATVIACRQAFS